MPGVRLAQPAALTPAQLALVHTADYIEAVRSGEPRALAESQKFPWSPELFGSVCLTGGGCLCAAREALETGVGAALVSGFHHAFADHGEGFCTFNGWIVTLEVLFGERRITRGAVLDLDLHYGNGTASLAESRPHVRAVSEYGSDYHENCAYRDVTVRRHRDGQNHRSFALRISGYSAHSSASRADLKPACENRRLGFHPFERVHLLIPCAKQLRL
jgi:acetoin utilization deacetylase AcuC-like enzyme